MKYVYALILAAPLLAQTTLPGGSIPVPLPPVQQQTFTSGMVGFATGQTARLNVFNMNSLPSTASLAGALTPANCTIEMQFFDNKGASVGQSTVPSFAPGVSAVLDLPRANVTSETAARAEIRAVVIINPTPTPVESPAPVGNCAVLTTLEIFDAAGSTVALTSDFRPVMPSLFAVIAPGPLK